MKQKSLIYFWAILAAQLSLGTASAAVVIWDDGGADSNWTTPKNWNNDIGPAAEDEVTIGEKFTVNFDRADNHGNLERGLILDIAGTLDSPGVIRMNGSTLNVASSGTISGGHFWDLQNATINFADGASATMNDWEQKDTNNFTYTLSSTGFTTLTPKIFRLGDGGLPRNIANATYTVDMANYSGPVGIITLMDFEIDGSDMDNATFQGAGGLNVINSGRYIANIQWNDIEEAIELNITARPNTLAITKIDYVSAINSLTLTWQSFPTAIYSVKFSTDMTDWGADLSDNLSILDDENPDDGDHITVTFVLPELIVDETKLFFRIEAE